MFALPDYWWLLGLALLPQVAFAVVLAIFRKSGTSADTTAGTPTRSSSQVPMWAVVMLCAGAAVGIGYGIVQHDGVFILGQVCVVIIALVRNRLARREQDETRIP